MAEKKTTSSANLFGQPLGADLSFDQFSSGPRLFTPVPPSKSSPQIISTGLPTPPFAENPPPLNTTFPASNVPRQIAPGQNASFSNLPVTSPVLFNTVTPRIPSFTPSTLPMASPHPMSIGQQTFSSPSMQFKNPNVGIITPPSQMSSTAFTPSPIPTFKPPDSQYNLSGPLIPPSTITTTASSNRPMQIVPPQPVTPLTTTPMSQHSNLPPRHHIPSSILSPASLSQGGTLASPSTRQQATPTQNSPEQQTMPPQNSSQQQAMPPQNSSQHQPQLPQDYNISPFAQNETSAKDEDQTALQQTITKVVPHWFFLKTTVQWLPFYKSSTSWVSFSVIDSRNLEHEYLMQKTKKQSSIVRTDGGRYDVDLSRMERNSVYWNELPSLVRRCTWFVKEENEFIPYEVEIAEKLEEGFLSMMSSGVFNVRIDISPGTFALFHNPNVLVQYNENQDMEWTGEDAKARPKVVRRGLSDEMKAEIVEGEEGPIEHVVFVVHGIGPVADLRMRSIVDCVDDLRKNSLKFTDTHGFTVKGRRANRVEFFPIQWYGSLHDDKSGIDRQLNSLSLPSITKLRNFTNEVLTDILFFTSPIYCQTICDTVVDEMNRIYKLFISRTPNYKGTTSIVGHSLGACISFDILANQQDDGGQSEMFEDVGDNVETITSKKSDVSTSLNTSALNSSITSESSCQSMHDILTKLNLLNLEKQFTEEQIDVDSLMVCQEADLRDLGVPFGPRKKLLAYIKGMGSSELSPRSSDITPSSSSTQASFADILSTRGTQTPVQVSSSNGQVVDSVECSYKKGRVGTGMPTITYKKLEFETDALFCLGSPIGLFLTCRGVTNIGHDYKLPKCQNFMNIFHPYDPVVYRLEPLINENIDIPPVLIPHHKGRKRFHLEIKENLTRVGANLKSGIMNAFSMTWNSLNDFARSHQGVHQPQQAEIEEQEKEDELSIIDQEEMERKRKEESLDFGQLNEGKRIDYVLQEKPFEILNEYLFALGSHTCYWTSEDTALLILKQIYKVQE